MGDASLVLSCQTGEIGQRTTDMGAMGRARPPPQGDLLEEFLTTKVGPSLPRGFIETFFDRGVGRNTGVAKPWDKGCCLFQHKFLG